MSFKSLQLSVSSVSLSSTGSHSEDWDRMPDLNGSEPSSSIHYPDSTTTPRSSLVFPSDPDSTPKRSSASQGTTNASGAQTGRTHTKGKRSLSELMQLHAEKGTESTLSVEEVSRVAEVLGQWINAESSPYEGEDDFFASSQDALDLSSRTTSSQTSDATRQHGQRESNPVSG